MTSENSQVGPEIEQSIRLILSVLRSAGNSDLAVRCVESTDAREPLGALGRQINALIEQLDSVHRDTALVQRAIEDQLDTIDRQEDVLRALATPVMEAWPGILCVAVMGVLDDVRARETTEHLLRMISRKATRLIVVDLTGAETIDSDSSGHLVQLVRAVRCLGADCVLSGLSPAIAATLIRAGVDLSEIQTFRTTRQALKAYLLQHSVGGTAPARDRGAR